VGHILVTQDKKQQDKQPSRVRGIGTGIMVVVILGGAALGFWAYGPSVAPRGAPARAQGSAERAPPLIREGERILVPPDSPVLGKLVVAAVEERAIQRALTLPAVVEADPARTVKVLPPVTGRVIDLSVELGSRVERGQQLAVIDSSDLAQAYADDEKARAMLTLTKQSLDRMMSLEKTNAVSIRERQQAQSDYAQAQAELARSQSRLRAIGVPTDQIAAQTDPNKLRLLSVKAPVSGSVIDLQIAPGAYVNDPTAAVMTIADLSTVWVTANVPEKDTALVTKGQSVEVQFTAYPGETFNGQVLFASDVLDADTRRTRVRIAFENPKLRLKPNMFANAMFLAPTQTMPVVPNAALVLRNEVDQVFVETAPRTFEARPVDVGFQQNEESVITRGLKAGDRVVVKGGVLLND
jgi:membrane fusion protein, heavy metal efflux system